MSQRERMRTRQGDSAGGRNRPAPFDSTEVLVHIEELIDSSGQTTDRSLVADAIGLELSRRLREGSMSPLTLENNLITGIVQAIIRESTFAHGNLEALTGEPSQ